MTGVFAQEAMLIVFFVKRKWLWSVLLAPMRGAFYFICL
jgi:hypothetical protein